MNYDFNKIDEYVKKKYNQDFFDNLQSKTNDDFLFIIKTKYLNEILKYDIDVDILLNINTQELVTAYVERVSYKKYKIYLNKKLMTILVYFADELSNNESFFEKIDRKKENDTILERLSQTILQIWINFIICHETAHIIRGHIDNDKMYYFEHEINKKDYNENLFYEVDADNSAIKIFIQILSDQLSLICKLTKLKDITVIEYILTYLVKLFEIFFKINNKDKEKIYYDHIIRIAVSLISICEVQNESNCLPIKLKELEKMTKNIFDDFLDENKYMLSNFEFQTKSKYIIENYKPFLCKINISEKQLIDRKKIKFYEEKIK